MRLLKLIIENYKSFQFRTEINFTHGSTERGRNIFLIGGMNGAGKTAIFEALNICLYGEKNKRILSAMNRKEVARGNVACTFKLYLEMDEGAEVVVERSWAGPPSSDHSRPGDLEEKLTIIKDGKPVSLASQQMWQEYLDVRIPKGITQFFFFDGEKIQDMAADEHAELKLKSSMEAALGIQLVRKLVEDLTYVRNEERRNRLDITDEDIRLKENELQILRRKREKGKESRDEINRDIKEFETELEQRRNRFSALFGFESGDAEDQRIKERRRIQTTTRLSDIEQEVRRFVETTLPLALVGSLFGELRTQIDAEAEARRATAVQDLAEDIADSVLEKATSPTTVCCNRKLSESERRLLRDRILEAVRQFSPKTKQPTENRCLLQLSQTDRARVLVRLDEVEKECPSGFERLVKEKAETAVQLKDLERDLRRERVSDSDKELFNQLQTEIESYATQQGRKREESTLAEGKLVDLDDTISSAERALSVLYEKHASTKERELFLNQCETLIELLTEYVDRLRETKIAELQDRTFEMYRKLASKGDLIASVEVHPETYMITIKDRSGHVVAKQNLSAGEKEVFAIALLWGLAQTSQLNLPVVIDTPLSRLDSKHRDSIVRNYLPQAGDQVIVLSTDTEVDESYYRDIEVHLQHAIRLNFDKQRELTAVEEGYFWE